jgi:hypothetical protein
VLRVTSPTAGSRRLLLTRPAREGPVQPLGGYARRARLPVRCVRTRRNETPLAANPARRQSARAAHRTRGRPARPESGADTSGTTPRAAPASTPHPQCGETGARTCTHPTKRHRQLGFVCARGRPRPPRAQAAGPLEAHSWHRFVVDGPGWVLDGVGAGDVDVPDRANGRHLLGLTSAARVAGA